MLREGHIGLTLLIMAPIGLLVGSIFPKYTIILVISGALTGSNLPDIDTTTKLVKHRGFTHTIWFIGIATLISGGIMYSILFYIPIERFIQFTTADQAISAVIFGLSVGMGVFTHLLGDVITPAGIRPFDPVIPRDKIPITVSDKKYVYEIRNASDPLLNKGFSVLGIVSVVLSSYIVNLQIL